MSGLGYIQFENNQTEVIEIEHSTADHKFTENCRTVSEKAKFSAVGAVELPVAKSKQAQW